MLSLISGCASMSPAQQRGVVIGAASGAVLGAGLGCGIARASYGSVGQDDGLAYEIGCPVGFVGGAIIGGTIGYLLAKEAPPPPPPQERIILRGVHFDFDKSRIRPDAAPILDEAADILGKHPDVTVDVNGYCDIIGGFAYNLRLSDRRANAVAGYLEGKGIATNRLVTHGYGKTHFVATNATAEGRAQNRRVELVPVGQ